MNESQKRRLANKIARTIMQSGDGPTPCQRIQFKGGTFPDHETNQGGFCESALSECILKVIREELP